jgi:membrane protein DedA with SNARE-associated domain
MLNIAGFALPDTPILPYLLIGLAATLEGPITLMATGVFASSGILLPLPAIVSVVVGNLAADMGWYGLGRLGKLEWLTRLGPKFTSLQAQARSLETQVQKYAPQLLLLSKLTVGLPIPTLIATGLSRVPVRRWVLHLVLGEMLKSTVLVGVGYLFASAIQQASSGVQVFLWGVTAIMLISITIFMKRKTSRA